MSEIDELDARIRALLVSLHLKLAPEERAEVEELLDHAELGEALRTLAWVIVEEDAQVARATLLEIEALASRMAISNELPPALREQGADND